MTDVHYKIRYIKGDKKIDTYVTLKPTTWGESRVSQIWDYCLANNIRPEQTVILENSTVSSRISLLQAYKEWLLK